MIEAKSSKIYFVGDSGYGDGSQFRTAAQKHGGFDLVMLPIGAYEPASFMTDSHMRPTQALQAMKDSGAKRAIAHHFETFQLGFESYDAPRKELEQAIRAKQVSPDTFVIPMRGQLIELKQ